jgi:hypothetical protein
MQSSQTLQATSPVLLSTSRCFQTPMELSKVLSESARAFSGAPESTYSYGGAFRMLRDLPYRIVKFWSSQNLCTDQLETSRAAETAVQLCRRFRKQPRPLHSTQPHGILSYDINLCYGHKICYIKIWHALLKSLYIYTYSQSDHRW